MDTIISECKWYATKVSVFLTEHVFNSILVYVLALYMPSFIARASPYKMRVCAGAICIVAHLLKEHKTSYLWVYQMLTTILTVEAMYIAWSISPQATMQGDADYWVLAEYIGCILVPAAFVDTVVDGIKND